jgi:hypothetical protein
MDWDGGGCGKSGIGPLSCIVTESSRVRSSGDSTRGPLRLAFVGWMCLTWRPICIQALQGAHAQEYPIAGLNRQGGVMGERTP